MRRQDKALVVGLIVGLALAGMLAFLLYAAVMGVK